MYPIDIPQEQLTDYLMTTRERTNFITKVYLCLDFQLLLTFGLCLYSNLNNLTEFYKSDIGRGILGLSIFGLISTFCTLLCCTSLFQRGICKYVMLLIFSSSISYIVSNMLVYYDPQTIILATGLTLTDLLLMTIISFFINIYSYFTEFLFISCLSLILLGIINTIMMSNFLQLIIAFSGSIVFSGFIIYDTKMIVSNKYRVYSRNDFVLASINLYLDIINLFMYTLECLTLSTGEN